MATGQRSFDPDDFYDDRREQIERQRAREDRQRQQDDAARRFAEDEFRRALEDQRLAQLEANRARMEAMMTLVNDDKIELSSDEVKVINDRNMRMMPNGEIVRRTAPGARDIIRRSGQFSLQNILPRQLNLGKKNRKKTKKYKISAKFSKFS